ncbi:MAG: hypothetical protein AAF569_04705 [Pseudomonadota bacterium]
MMKKTKGWSPKRRAEQAARCRKTKPWERATGPKTEAGKAASAQNATRHGLYTQDYDRLRALLRTQEALLRALSSLPTPPESAHDDNHIKPLSLDFSFSAEASDDKYSEATLGAQRRTEKGKVSDNP